MIQSLDSPACSLSLSQTSSDIRFGDRNPALLRTDIAHCWLRKNIRSGLLLGSWNNWQHIEMPHYFSWFMAQTIYSPVCLFPYVKLQLEL